MATKKKLLEAAAGSAGGGGGLNVEDVFSTYLYEGNGTTNTITNGIDLSGEGGMVWLKARSYTGEHTIYDTERGVSKWIEPSTTDAEATSIYALDQFNSDGFRLPSNLNNTNRNAEDIASWTFRKAPKFFDVVTYTGTGSATTISHNLGSVPGCIIVKCTSNARDWYVYHRGSNGGTNPEQYKLNLNSTAAAATETDAWNDTAPTSSVFTVGSVSNVNASGFTYVAYLFAHNDGDGDFGPTGDQDIIKCGSYTGGNGTDVSVDLGFEPQWVMVKKSSGAANWVIADNMRGISSFSSGNNTKELEPNTVDAESFNEGIRLNPNGFTAFSNQGQWNGSGTYTYIAIRRGPMAVPESATDVFAIDTANSTGNAPPLYEAGFPVDFAIQRLNKHSTKDWDAVTRLTQGKALVTNSTAAEVGAGAYAFDYQTGWSDNTGTDTNDIAWMWKRAPNYFDVVAYTGTGSNRTVSHNLGVVPEMMWVKRRSASEDWNIYHKDLLATEYLQFNTDAATTTNGTLRWNSTRPTDSVFSVGTHASINASSSTYIAYLFASLDGVSKVGSYTGDGTTDGSNVVDCGFTNGARFILVKMADGTSNWGVFDTERGIVSGNDPRLFLNTTAAELTTVDFLVPNSSGFAFINGFNSTGYTYIFYAIAA